MKISFFVHDLAANPIARSEPLIKALERLGHSVQVLGMLIGKSQVYEPYRELHDYRCLQTSGTVTDVLTKASELARMADGEVTFGGKPLLTSFYPALLASGFGRKKPLFLDTEDDDVWGPFGTDTWGGFLNHHIRGFRSATCTKYGMMLHPFIQRCAGVTVSSRALQKRYGGVILRHGPDEQRFDPSRPELDKAKCREELGLPLDKTLVLFAGTSRHHKGLVMLENAISKRDDVVLVLCGPKEQTDFQKLSTSLGPKAILLGSQPNFRMPTVVAAADIVPVLQMRSTYTEAQLPAKLVEAMAMGKWIIGTRVGDIPVLLGENDSQRRGWVIDPEDVHAFTVALEEIINTPREALEQISRDTRSYFLKNASVEANALILDGLLKKVA